MMRRTLAFRAEARDYDTLIKALYDRAELLNVSRLWIDDAAKLADGYAGKLLGAGRVRRLGAVSRTHVKRTRVEASRC